MFKFSRIIQLTPKIRAMSTDKLSKRFQDKVAVITASTEGIGLACARRLGEEGASVVISSRRAEKVEKAVKELQGEGLDVIGTVCHVGLEEDRKKLMEFAVKERGGIDVFVSNAAVNPVTLPVLETNEGAWDKVFDTNVKASFLLTKSAVEQMKKRGGGSIIYVSSIAAFQPMSLLGAYSVSKTALLGLTKVLATECADLNIRVNCVCPGIIKTKFSTILWNSPQALEYMNNFIPMKRPGEVHEISSLVAFLASSDASYITGESFVAAGGFHSRL